MLRLLLIALGCHLQLLLLLLECYGEIHTLIELRSAANFGHLPISMENCLQLWLLIYKRSWTLGSRYKSSMIDIRWHKANIDNEYSPHSLTPPLALVCLRAARCLSISMPDKHSRTFPAEFSIVLAYCRYVFHFHRLLFVLYLALCLLI